MFEISGSVPPSHLEGGYAVAVGWRQNPVYFPLGGSTIKGVARAWEWTDVRTLDAADYGVPSRCRRTFLVASRSTPAASLGLELGRTSMADALSCDTGHAITTRGARRPTGGNVFSADGPSRCLTVSSRTWELENRLRLTPAQAGELVGLRLNAWGRMPAPRPPMLRW